jgi:hypothetical protein
VTQPNLSCKEAPARNGLDAGQIGNHHRLKSPGMFANAPTLPVCSRLIADVQALARGVSSADRLAQTDIRTSTNGM